MRKLRAKGVFGMPSTRVKSTAVDRREVGSLRREWAGAGSHLETAVPAGLCSVPGCRTMPFVTLRTENGRRPVCLRHFELVQTTEDA